MMQVSGLHRTAMRRQPLTGARSGLLPAAISRDAAVLGPTPKVLTRVGATDRESRSSSASRSRTSSLS